jgi:hypothetical protein
MKAKLILVLAMCVLGMLAFSTVGMAAVPTFEHTKYSGHPGDDVNAVVTYGNSTLNTTTSDIIDSGYWNDIDVLIPFTDTENEYMTDFDTSTGVNVTTIIPGGGSCMVDEDSYGTISYCLEFNINPITHFDGIWVKKSIGLEMQFTISNNTNGFRVSEYIVNFQDGIDYFPSTINQSYKFADLLTPYGEVLCAFGDLTQEQWVATYGSIDHVSIFITADDGLDHYCNLYEWHLFDTHVTLADVIIADEDYDYLAWATSNVESPAGTWTITISVPQTAAAGTYFILTEFSDGKDTMSTLEVTVEAVHNTNLIYFILLAFMGAFILYALAGILANSGRDWEGVVALSVIATLLLCVAIVYSADMLGWIPAGWPGNGLAGIIMLAPAGLACKMQKVSRKRLAVLGLTVLLGLGAVAGLASATYTVTPANDTIKAGDHTAFTLSSTTGGLDSKLMSVEVRLYDGDVYSTETWTYTITVSSDNETAIVRLTAPDGALDGTYKVLIQQVSETLKTVTVYVTSEVARDYTIFWILCMWFLISIIVFMATYAQVKRSPNKTDDTAAYLLLISGLVAIGAALTWLFNFWQMP